MKEILNSKITSAQYPEKSLVLNSQEILKDYYTAHLSRSLSHLGRREVFTGKAKFGIFGDGVEVPQLAMAHVFQEGDFRSGYYRDQTFILASGIATPENLFSQLYADQAHDIFSRGRSMNSHFSTSFIDKDLEKHKNSSSDISPSSGQMPRMLGLAYTSKILRSWGQKDDSVTYGTIGDAATSEGAFWETLNAASLLQVPLVIAIWDNGYGISVPTSLQTVHGSISKALEGFAPHLQIYKVKGYDYKSCLEAFFEADIYARVHHKPCLIHVTDLTQPFAHSSSGSHERYKSEERLTWEKDNDCLIHFKQWILDQGFASLEDLNQIQTKAYEEAINSRNEAWRKYELQKIEIEDKPSSLKAYFQKSRLNLLKNSQSSVEQIQNITSQYLEHKQSYSSELTCSEDNIFIQEDPIFTSESMDGRKILVHLFDSLLKRNSKVLIFGEDVGKLGDVNLVYEGLQSKYGEDRIIDTGIRENTLIGQGIGCALRGLRPIVDIQYIDYLVYALSTLTDDLATLSYRTVGQQRAPVIIRTKGHRLEGIWHSGSPMSMMLSSMRGIYLCVPRNMVQAAGFYNTLLTLETPGIVVEVLNGYRLKEVLPENIDTFKVPLGTPECLKVGKDITIITYGACCKIALDAASFLEENLNIQCEVWDIQTLWPLDSKNIILPSLQKTGKLIILDEDVPGGASAYILDRYLKESFHILKKAPICITGTEHRTPYGSDGDYFCKPQVDDVLEKCLELLEPI